MRMLVLVAAFSVSLLSSVALAATPPKYSVQWSPADSVRPGAERALVRIGDQEYGLTLARRDFNARELIAFDPPVPWRVRNRPDLVPILRQALAEPDSVDHLAYYWIANLVLPHIDSPSAAAAYARLRWESGRQPELHRGFLTALNPDDALPQPIWMSFAAEPEVLPILQAHVGDMAPQGYVDTYPLAVLGMSNDPRALAALRSAFEARPDRWPRYALGVLTDHPSDRTRRYLLTTILPRLASERPDSLEVGFAIDVWRELARPGTWESIGYGDSMRTLGHRFVGTTLSQPDFPGYPFLGSRAPKDAGSMSWLACIDGGWGEMFLDACAGFGDSEQAKRLERALKPTEGWMSDAEAKRTWDSHYFTGWTSFDSIVEDYTKKKQEALALMRQREP